MCVMSLKKTIMDYEKNKEAIEMVKQMVADGQVSQDVAEKYFPEIAESKNDKIRKRLIEYFGDDGEWSNGISYKEVRDWIEKQKPTEWSEEDEKIVAGLISIVEGWYNNQSQEEKDYYGDCGYIDWLKSLRPVKNWRPTAEQMRVLSRFRSVGVPDVRGNDLVLFDELFKKLCEL